VRWPAWLSAQPLGDAPPWFWWAVGLAGGAIGWLWFDLLVNWRWVLAWLTGAGK
jgi:hypothetical protein